MKTEYGNIITPGSLEKTNEYLKMTKEEKENACIEIVSKAFARMKTNTTLDQRKRVMENVLDRSLRYLEDRDEFEQAQVILDLKNTIPKVFEVLSHNVEK